MTLTLELPDDLAALIASIPPEQRNTFAVAALWEKIEDEENLPVVKPTTYPLTEEDKAILGRSFADGDAGRVIDGETFLAELRQLTGRTK